MKSKDSLLFIPDISGFTDFVNQTEIQHSGHIISELLEVLIDSNQLGMTVSEIEGDAVLFFKNNHVPALNEILEQTKKMYINFHNHLKYYESNRVCNCGACCTAAQLKLKIIAHSGDLGFINVKNRKKPHGKEVILIHRLLKNSVTEKEYLLITDTLASNDKDMIQNLEILKGSTHYDGLGEVSYSYINLDIFKKELLEASPVTKLKKISNPLKYDGYIDRDINDVFEILTNLDIRLTWLEGIDKLRYKKNRVNRIGTKHTCVINGKDIEFETVSNDFGKNRLVYGERVVAIPIVKEFIIYNIMEEENDGTRIFFEVHYKPLPFIGWLFLPIFKKTFRKNIRDTFFNLKNACESDLLPIYNQPLK